MSAGREHFDTAAKLLAAVGEEKDAQWALVTVTRAMAHATLAAAARDYALHVAPRHPSVSQQYTAAGKPIMDEDEPTVAPAEVIDMFRARDIAALNRMLDDE